MFEVVHESAIKAGVIAAESFEGGIRDLYRTTEDDGVCCLRYRRADFSKGVIEWAIICFSF